MGKAQGCGQFKGGAPGILGERAVEARRDPRREGRGPLAQRRGRDDAARAAAGAGVRARGACGEEAKRACAGGRWRWQAE